MSLRTQLISLRSGVSRASEQHPVRMLGLAALAIPLAVTLWWAAGRVVHMGKVLSGVWVNEFVASGLGRTQLDKDLTPIANHLNLRPVTVHLEGMVFRFEPRQVGASVDVPGTAALALAQGRDTGLLSEFGWWLSGFIESHRVPFVVRFERAKLDQLATKWERAAISDPPVAGDVRAQGDSLVLEEPRAGRRIDRGQLARDLARVLGQSQGRVIELTTERVEPRLQKQVVEQALARGRRMVAAPVQLVSADGKLVLRLSREELRRALSSRAESEPPALQLYFDHDAIQAVIDKHRERFEREPVDASFRVGKDQQVHIVPGRPGTRLDPQMVAEALFQAVYAPGHIGQLPVERDALPELTTESARALNIVKLVGRFSTRHACCQARVQNIHRIADLLNGTVVKPGEVFSVNEKIGPRTKASGFVPAPTIVEGDMEDTVGGGVSQFATTLFNALFYGGYDIIERQPHSYWFPRYPMGHEATLSYPKPDIIFRNDTKSGVLITTEYSDTQITVKLYGDNEGRKVKATISGRMDIIDPPVELVADPSVEPDEEKTLNAGMVGWSVIAGRIITFKDKTQKVEKRKVTYMPRVRRIRVHPCRIPEGEKGYTGQDCPEPKDAEINDDSQQGATVGETPPGDPAPADATPHPAATVGAAPAQDL